MTNLETHMYDWIFHYNIYSDLWEAVRRDEYTSLFNGGNVIRSSDIMTLIGLINKTNGDLGKVKIDD